MVEPDLQVIRNTLAIGDGIEDQVSRNMISGIIAIPIITVLFFLEWRSDPTVLTSTLALNAVVVVVCLTLSLLAQELAVRSSPFAHALRSAGSMPAVVMLLAATAVFRISSVEMLPAAVLCLGILIGTAATLGELSRAGKALGSAVQDEGTPSREIRPPGDQTA